jgi:type IV secretion system protein VirD4
MSFPFGWTKKQGPRKSRPFVKEAPIDPEGRRFLGFTLETHQPIWAPKGHSLLLSANGGGKTTRGLTPWLFSLLASTDRPCILVLDSKDGEIAAQCCPMLEQMGVPTAVIDDTCVLPSDIYGRTSINPLDTAVWTHLHQPLDLVFANDSITKTLIPEPGGESDERNRYWRSWPRLLIEAALYILLKRNPELATPGGVWMLLSSPQKLISFAEIEAIEGDGMLKVLAENIIAFADHEHFPQHLQAAQEALRLFAVGTRLHMAGHEAATNPFELIRKRTVIFLTGGQAHMHALGTVYGLVLMSFIRAAYLGAGPLWIGADEFTNAPTRELVTALTTLRAYGVTVSMIAQSRSEIERKLGRNETLTIEENAILKQWFGFSSFEEAERVSKAMGEEHAVGASVGGGNDSLKMQTNLSLVRQAIRSPAELMAMPKDHFLAHMKGIGFLFGRSAGQNNIAPYCDLIADNPLEGGRLPSDPWITFTMPEEART